MKEVPPAKPPKRQVTKTNSNDSDMSSFDLSGGLLATRKGAVAKAKSKREPKAPKDNTDNQSPPPKPKLNPSKAVTGWQLRQKQIKKKQMAEK